MTQTLEDRAGTSTAYAGAGGIDYKRMLDCMNDGVAIVGKMDHGRIQYANPALFQMTGKNAEELLEISLMDIVSKDSSDALSDFFKRFGTEAISPANNRIEYAIDGQDGTRVIIDMKVNYIEHKGQDALLCTMSDITERRKSTEEIARLRHEQAQTLGNISDIVICYSADNLTITSVNDAAQGLYGKPEKDFLSGAFGPISSVHQRDRELVEDFYAKVPEEEDITLNYRIRRPDGKIRHVSDRGRVIYGRGGKIQMIIHTITDTTDYVEARERLDDVLEHLNSALEQARSSEKKLNDLFEFMPNLIYIVREGKIENINPAGVRLLGYDKKEELIGKNIADFYVNPTERDNLVRELKQQRIVKDFKAQFKKKDESPVDITISAFVKENGGDEIKSNFGMAHDITDVLQREWLKAVHDIMTTVKHEINNPLTILNNYSGLIRDSKAWILEMADKNPEYKERCKELLDNADGIYGMVFRISDAIKLIDKVMRKSPTDGFGIIDIRAK